MSAKVTDGWSQRGLRALLRVSPARLRYLIGNAMLRVRDSRHYFEFFGGFVQEEPSITDPSSTERLTAAIARDDAHSWERAASLLALRSRRIAESDFRQSAEARGYVCHRQVVEGVLQEAWRRNKYLADGSRRAKWLASEYGVSGSGNGRTVSSAQKHAFSDQKVQVRKENSWQCLFQAREALPS